MAKLIKHFPLKSLSSGKTVVPTGFKTVVVEGNIASGKTEFLRFFEGKRKAKIFAEPIEKWRHASGFNLLDLLYLNPARWSLAFQSYVQLTMLDAHNRSDGLQDGDVKIMERSIYSAKYCFVENLHQSQVMTDVEYTVLTEWFKWIIAHSYCNVDLIVYLQTNPETVYERLVKRNRPEERHVPLNYLKALHNLHEYWLTLEKFPLPAGARIKVIDANADLKTLRPIYEKTVENILSNDDHDVINGDALSLS